MASKGKSRRSGRVAAGKSRIPGGKKGRRRQLSWEEALIDDHVQWVKNGGGRCAEKDFSAAPIALRYGMPGEFRRTKR